MNADVGDVSVFVLLGLTAAFDTMDHKVPTNRSFFGFHLNSGVPQGSVVGPIIFSIYLFQHSDIIRKDGISFHCYADTMYLPVKPNDQAQLYA